MISVTRSSRISGSIGPSCWYYSSILIPGIRTAIRQPPAVIQTPTNYTVWAHDLHTVTRATAAPITGPDPAALSAAAHASRVAPVVATSSTTRIDLPARLGPSHSNAPWTFFWRHRRS